jgi:ADP-heptose:LPS heptosyltransferase
MSGKVTNIKNDNKEIWINPVGSYGDMLMLSGVLKQCMDSNPRQRFCLVRRAIYTDLLNGHPAIKEVGYPPKNASVITTDYWLKEKPGTDNNRPYQILARLFGLQTPVIENLYLPGKNDEDKLLLDFIPSDDKKIAVIAPTSMTPRKMMGPLIWQDITERLRNRGIMVIQVGHKDDIYIKGSYSLLGLTTPRQLITLMIKSNVIISVDNFIMYVAHLICKPAIIIWGPTNSKVYGYAEQIHIQCPTNHCEFRNKCLGPEFSANASSPCPLKDKHCMSLVSIDTIIENTFDIFSKK